jgi:hypothetical protein
VVGQPLTRRQTGVAGEVVGDHQDVPGWIGRLHQLREPLIVDAVREAAVQVTAWPSLPASLRTVRSSAGSWGGRALSRVGTGSPGRWQEATKPTRLIIYSQIEERSTRGEARAGSTPETEAQGRALNTPAALALRRRPCRRPGLRVAAQQSAINGARPLLLAENGDRHEQVRIWRLGLRRCMGRVAGPMGKVQPLSPADH